MIKILIIDDHPLVIDGIRTMLKDESYVRIEAAAKTAKEALGILEDEAAIDIILLDINLPDIDGLRLCELIRQKNKTVKIIGLTYVNEAGIITQLIKKGANGYLLKNMEREELITAINQVMDGTIYLSKAANEKIIQQLQSLGLPQNNIPVLTRREKEILQLLSEGLTSQEIASRLFLSSYTVDTHRKNMLQKFNVHNTPSLMNVVRELGIIA
ncbi:MAG: response regulator transcription factor [Chitinophagaceae bacterium]|nr:response regulator transcription factor [Chitinophagaceae bacterium]